MLLYLFAININGLDLKVYADCAKKKNSTVSTECTLKIRGRGISYFFFFLKYLRRLI